MDIHVKIVRVLTAIILCTLIAGSLSFSQQTFKEYITDDAFVILKDEPCDFYKSDYKDFLPHELWKQKLMQILPHDNSN